MTVGTAVSCGNSKTLNIKAPFCGGCTPDRPNLSHPPRASPGGGRRFPFRQGPLASGSNQSALSQARLFRPPFDFPRGFPAIRRLAASAIRQRTGPRQVATALQAPRSKPVRTRSSESEGGWGTNQSVQVLVGQCIANLEESEVDPGWDVRARGSGGELVRRCGRRRARSAHQMVAIEPGAFWFLSPAKINDQAWLGEPRAI